MPEEHLQMDWVGGVEFSREISLVLVKVLMGIMGNLQPWTTASADNVTPSLACQRRHKAKGFYVRSFAG